MSLPSDSAVFSHAAKFEEVYGLLHDAGVSTRILEPSLELDTFKYVRPGSRTFNSITVACSLLTVNPDRELAREIVEAPANIPKLGKHLIDIVNSSIIRAEDTPHTFKHSRRWIDTCSDTEDNFAVAMGQYRGRLVSDGKKQNELYIDEQGMPVFFRKAVGPVRSALSLTDIEADGVKHGAFTVARVDRVRRGATHAALRGCNVFLTEVIKGVAPMRLSTYALDTEERQDASPFTDADERTHIFVAERDLNQADLLSRLPHRDDLEEIAHYLSGIK